MVDAGKYTSPMDPMGDDRRKADIGQVELKFFGFVFLAMRCLQRAFHGAYDDVFFGGFFELDWDSFNNVQNDPNGNHTNYSERDTQFG